jgi:hypothetical protein
MCFLWVVHSEPIYGAVKTVRGDSTERQQQSPGGYKRRLGLNCEDFALCVIVLVIIWRVVILCGYNLNLPPKKLCQIGNPLVICHGYPDT